MRVYHGTDMSSALDILTNGWQDTERIWSQSNYDNVYFWVDDFFPDFDSTDSAEYRQQVLVQRALESGYLSAIKRNTATIVVLEYEIADDLVERDNSDEHMIDSGAGQVAITDASKAILQNVHICQLPARLMLLFLSSHELDYGADLGLTAAEYNFVKSNRADSIDTFNDFLSTYRTSSAENALANLHNLNRAENVG